MAYIGIRLEDSLGRIDLKLHGPINDPNINVLKLVDLVRHILGKTHLDVMDMCRDLSETAIEHFGDGDNIVWAQTEFVSTNGIIAGASAEKVLVG